MNADLADQPGKVNEAPYVAGWLFRMRVADSKQAQGLLDADGVSGHGGCGVVSRDRDGPGPLGELLEGEGSSCAISGQVRESRASSSPRSAAIRSTRSLPGRFRRTLCSIARSICPHRWTCARQVGRNRVRRRRSEARPRCGAGIRRPAAIPGHARAHPRSRAAAVRRQALPPLRSRRARRGQPATRAICPLRADATVAASSAMLSIICWCGTG